MQSCYLALSCPTYQSRPSCFHPCNFVAERNFYNTWHINCGCMFFTLAYTQGADPAFLGDEDSNSIEMGQLGTPHPTCKAPQINPALLELPSQPGVWDVLYTFWTWMLNAQSDAIGLPTCRHFASFVESGLDSLVPRLRTWKCRCVVADQRFISHSLAFVSSALTKDKGTRQCTIATLF